MLELWQLFAHKVKTEPWHVASAVLYMLGSICFLAGTVISFIQELRR